MILEEKKKEQIKALDNISGILSDLTSEQMNAFEEAAKRRGFKQYSTDGTWNITEYVILSR